MLLTPDEGVFAQKAWRANDNAEEIMPKGGGEKSGKKRLGRSSSRYAKARYSCRDVNLSIRRKKKTGRQAARLEI